MVKVGDIFEIPLSSGKKAYGQYVFRDRMGPMIQVFDLITNTKIHVEQLRDSKPLFPPIITGLSAAIKKEFWKVVGHLPVEKFEYPNFISTLYNDKTGKAGIWFLYNGEKYGRIGTILPKELKKLAFLIVWSPHDVVYRIETGEYPFPYLELIMHNEFTPRSR